MDTRLMNPNRPTEAAASAEAVVEDALRTYPLSPVPPGLSTSTMARVRLLAPKPRFHLLWSDVALSLSLSGMVGLVLLVWQMIPPNYAARMRVQWLLLWQQFRLTTQWPTLWPVVLGGVILALVAFIVAALIFNRSRRLEYG